MAFQTSHPLLQDVDDLLVHITDPLPSSYREQCSIHADPSLWIHPVLQTLQSFGC